MTFEERQRRAYFLWLNAGKPEGMSEYFWREAYISDSRIEDSITSRSSSWNPGTNPQTAKDYEASKAAISSGRGTNSDYYNVSEWEWDQQPGGDQRR